MQQKIPSTKIKSIKSYYYTTPVGTAAHYTSLML